ncbi:MAG: 7-cyano-7-deazaguanine synthase QueC [Thermoguttaceae bacterium]
MSKAVVLLSGGLDSSTVAAIAQSQGHDLYALTIHYNQRHAIELDAAREVAVFFGVKKHVIFPLDLRLFGGSALTDDWEVAKDVPLEKIGSEVPSTYVPARNTIFLSLALAFAETVSAREIYYGISSVDSSGYPDCRPEFLASFSDLAGLGTVRDERLGAWRIHAPLLHLSKAETIRKGLELGVDYGLTWTCYDPSPSLLSCGRCESCLLRLNGFRELGVPDPLVYTSAYQ